MGVTEKLSSEIYALNEKIRKLEQEADWLAENCQGKDQCPNLTFDWPIDKIPDWCVGMYSIEDGFDCDEDSVSCWRKAARNAVEAANVQN